MRFICLYTINKYIIIAILNLCQHFNNDKTSAWWSTPTNMFRFARCSGRGRGVIDSSTIHTTWHHLMVRKVVWLLTKMSLACQGEPVQTGGKKRKKKVRSFSALHFRESLNNHIVNGEYLRESISLFQQEIKELLSTESFLLLLMMIIFLTNKFNFCFICCFYTFSPKIKHYIP